MSRGGLVGGSKDGTVRVWGMVGGASGRRCEQTLDVQGSEVQCVAGWEGGVAGGCEDGGIRVSRGVGGRRRGGWSGLREIDSSHVGVKVHPRHLYPSHCIRVACNA